MRAVQRILPYTKQLVLYEMCIRDRLYFPLYFYTI